MSSKNTTTNVNIGAEFSAFTTAMQQMSIQAENLSKSLKSSFSTAANVVGQGSNDVARSTKKMGDSANLASANLVNMGSLISDLPYGFRGVANNISYAGTMMTELVKQSGSVNAALGSLWKQLMGPMGILMAFQAVIAAIDWYIGNGKKAKDTTEDLTGTITDEIVEIYALNDAIKTNEKNRDVQEKAYDRLKKLVPELSKMTLEEAINTGKLATETDKLIASKVRLWEVSEQIKKVTKLELEYQKAQKDRAKLVEDEVSFLEKVGNFFTSSEGGDILYSNVDKAAKRVELRFKEMAFNIENQKNELTRLLTIDNGLGITPVEPEKEESRGSGSGGVTKTETEAERLAKDLKWLQDENEKAYSVIDKQEEDYLKRHEKLLEERNKVSEKLNQEYIEGSKLIDTGEVFDKLDKDFERRIKQLGDSMNAMISTYIVSVFESLGEMIGEAIGGGDPMKSFGDKMLGSFADLLGKFGALLIAFGVGQEAFMKSLKTGNGVVAIAAGVAAVAAAGAIKGYLNKKASESNPIGNNSSSGSGSGSYSNNNELIVYSRLDGRDMVLVGQRNNIAQRR